MKAKTQEVTKITEEELSGISILRNKSLSLISPILIGIICCEFGEIIPALLPECEKILKTLKINRKKRSFPVQENVG